MLLATFFILVFTITFVRGEERCCEGVGCFKNTFPFNHIPLPECPERITPTYDLYTPSSPDVPSTLSRSAPLPASFAGDAETVILVHGWMNDEEDTWVPRAREAFFKLAEKRNVLVVGWGQGADSIWYPQSASNVRSIAADTDLVLQNLIQTGGSSPCRMYCVGFSLGAHVCGHIGRRTKLARITGLDPAGPMFTFNVFTLEVLHPDIGLRAEDAEFVDVIHSNAQGTIVPAGTFRPMGHMDFYPNGAGRQPGCGFIYSAQNNNTTTAAPEADWSCSHSRCFHYFLESIQSPCFVSRQRCKDERDLPASCSQGYEALMGFNSPGSGPHGLYYLDTNSSSPFCLG